MVRNVSLYSLKLQETQNFRNRNSNLFLTLNECLEEIFPIRVSVFSLISEHKQAG